MTSSEERAWAAGFFDGEGSIFTVWQLRKSGKRHPYTKVSVGNTFLPNLQRFQEAVGGLGQIYDAGPSKPGGKVRYYFSTNKWDTVQQIMTILWPYLGEEKRSATFEAFHDRCTEEALEEVLSNLERRS